MRYGVVVPVKPPAVAKSRLAALGDPARRDLVTAFATDTVLAALECPLVARVLVVTDDVTLARGFRELGVPSVPDGESGQLNASLRQGAAELVRREPTLRPVALCGDLPALRGAELGEVLQRASGGAAAFVPDLAGVGTTLYTAPTLEQFQPLFGAQSRQAHRAAGATELAAGTSVRRDVDTPDDLRDALRLGVGERTAWVATRIGLAT
jgi:2-phospho-L-lactate guanylyltransferase